MVNAQYALFLAKWCHYSVVNKAVNKVHVYVFSTTNSCVVSFVLPFNVSSLRATPQQEFSTST